MILKNKITLITGGSTGIGRATVETFAKQGATVIFCDINKNKGNLLQKNLQKNGFQTFFFKADVSKEKEVKLLYSYIKKKFKTIDIVFNNAGIEQAVTPSHKLNTKIFEKVIDVNLKGVFLSCKYALQIMEKNKKGSIVNNSSISAFANVGGNLSYAASKGGIMSLTRVLAIEYAKKNIRVNAVCPGVIDTPMTPLKGKARKEFYKNATKGNIIKRAGTAEEVANALLFAIENDFITGTTIDIDGGWILS